MADSIKSHQSFTIRVPISVYLELAKLAQDEGSNLNRKVNQVLILGLGHHISLNDALRAMLVRTMTEKENTVVE